MTGFDSVVGWEKLNAECAACGLEHADIRFTFLDRNSQFRMTYVRSYHWLCLSSELAEIQRRSEADMIEEAKRPATL